MYESVPNAHHIIKKIQSPRRRLQHTFMNQLLSSSRNIREGHQFLHQDTDIPSPGELNLQRLRPMLNTDFENFGSHRCRCFCHRAKLRSFAAQNRNEGMMTFAASIIFEILAISVNCYISSCNLSTCKIAQTAMKSMNSTF